MFPPALSIPHAPVPHRLSRIGAETMESKKSQLSQSFRLHSLSSSSFWWCWSLRITQGTGSNAYSCVPPCLLGVAVSRGCCHSVPQTRWLRPQKCILSQCWRPEVQDRGGSRTGLHPEEDLGASSLPTSSSFWCLPTFLGGSTCPSLPRSSHHLVLGAVCHISLSPLRTCVIGLRAHPDNPGLSPHIRTLS